MKIYNPDDYKEAPKKEILLNLAKNEKGSIDVVVCDEKGKVIFPICRIGNQKSVHQAGILTYSGVKEALIMQNYDVSYLDFEKDGSIKVFTG